MLFMEMRRLEDKLELLVGNEGSLLRDQDRVIVEQDYSDGPPKQPIRSVQLGEVKEVF
jgi:hypothetical protein